MNESITWLWRICKFSPYRMTKRSLKLHKTGTSGHFVVGGEAKQVAKNLRIFSAQETISGMSTLQHYIIAPTSRLFAFSAPLF